jgi:hypothetical protein
MRRFYRQSYSKFSFKKIIKKTEKATLFEMMPKILIWLPNNWLIKLTKTSFTVKDHIAINVKLKMNAELKTLYT